MSCLIARGYASRACSVLTGLAVLGDTGLELTNTGRNDEDTAIGLN